MKIVKYIPLKTVSLNKKNEPTYCYMSPIKPVNNIFSAVSAVFFSKIISPEMGKNITVNINNTPKNPNFFSVKTKDQLDKTRCSGYELLIP